MESYSTIRLDESTERIETPYYKELEKQIAICDSLITKFGFKGVIPDNIRNDIFEYLTSLNNVVTIEEINQRWLSFKIPESGDDPIDEKDEEKLWDVEENVSKIITGTRQILKNQLLILENKRVYKDDDKCKIYLVEVFSGNSIYGSVMVFNTPDRTVGMSRHKGLFMENITKFPIPNLCGIIFPELTRDVPKLNTLLIPEVSKITKSLGLKTIYVNPLYRQAKIIEKYYGFKKIPNKIDIFAFPVYLGPSMVGTFYKDV